MFTLVHSSNLKPVAKNTSFPTQYDGCLYYTRLNLLWIKKALTLFLSAHIFIEIEVLSAKPNRKRNIQITPTSIPKSSSKNTMIRRASTANVCFFTMRNAIKYIFDAECCFYYYFFKNYIVPSKVC